MTAGSKASIEKVNAYIFSNTLDREMVQATNEKVEDPPGRKEMTMKSVLLFSSCIIIVLQSYHT